MENKMGNDDSHVDHVAARRQAWEAAKGRDEPDGEHHNPQCCQDYSRTMGHVGAVMIPAFVPIMMIMVGFREYMTDETNPLQVYLWLLLFLFILAMIFCGVLLLETTNASSISEMVAQRWNKTSYLTLLMIATVSAFSSCFVPLSALFRAAMFPTSHNDYYWQPILGSLSPLISFAVLLFPLVVTKTASELQMIPRGVGVNLVGTIHVEHPTPLLADIINGSDRVDLAERSDRADPMAYNLYALPFLPCAALRSACAHKVLHFGVILVGVLLGWISIGGSLSVLQEGPIRNAASIGLTLSITFGVAFGVGTTFSRKEWKRFNKRWLLLLEYFALHFYLITLLYVSIASSEILIAKV